MRTLLTAAAVAALTTVATPALAETVTLYGCVTSTVTTTCAFDSATVYVDEEPLRRSFLACLYGTPVDWEGASVTVDDAGLDATYWTPVTGEQTLVDWPLGDHHYETGYVEGGPDLGGGCG